MNLLNKYKGDHLDNQVNNQWPVADWIKFSKLEYYY